MPPRSWCARPRTGERAGFISELQPIEGEGFHWSLDDPPESEQYLHCSPHFQETKPQDKKKSKINKSASIHFIRRAG